MNERILELADKVTEDLPGPWSIPDQFCKKFAELIVRECADVLATEMNRLDGQGLIISALIMDTAQVLIKQHFGVEE